MVVHELVQYLLVLFDILDVLLGYRHDVHRGLQHRLACLGFRVCAEKDRKAQEDLVETGQGRSGGPKAELSHSNELSGQEA